MTFIPKQQEKHCFVACSEDKVNAGHCDCINRMIKVVETCNLNVGGLSSALNKIREVYKN